MPIIRVEMLSGRSREQRKQLVEAFTSSMSRIAKCSPESIQIVFTEVEKQNWAVGGVLNDEKEAAQAS